MFNKIRIGAVSYLNTKPLLYGLEHSEINNEIEIILDYPSVLATKLKNNLIDIALLPIAAMSEINDARIISNYGIASDGNVKSVSIFSELPIKDVQILYLDYQSRTSVKLAEILLKHYWKLDVQYVGGDENYIEKIKGNNAGVIIGDRALTNINKFKHVYDLSAAWKDYTGLGFIFASWISNKDFSEDFIDKFNEANAYGLKFIADVIVQNPFSNYNLHTYYTENIVYYLDENKRKGMSLFLELLGTLK